MISTNVIQFAPALQRRRNRDMALLAIGNGGDSWLGRYPDGIDGLWVEGQEPIANILPFDRNPRIN